MHCEHFVLINTTEKSLQLFSSSDLVIGDLIFKSTEAEFSLD